MFKLLKGNMAQLCDGLDFSLLPPTFLDAIQVALALDIHYIWIDTLCIIQDSPEDWRHEASRMFEVYFNAHLNIAATKAVDASQGLFAQRHLSLLTTIINLGQGPRPGTYQLMAQKYWSQTVEQAALNQRAWVLQERLLSRRTLHFTSEQIIWDCCQSVHLETFQQELDEWTRRLVGFTGPKRNQNLLSMHKEDAEDGDKWLDVVQLYSKSLLSYQQDKLFALVGLVKHFERVLGDIYCAGMWRKSMLFHLTWYTQQDATLMPKIRNNRAPSWSWLAFDGAVTIPMAVESDHPSYERVKLAEVVDVNVGRVLSDSDDKFTGYLDIRTTLTPLSTGGDGTLMLAEPVRRPFKAQQTRLACKFEHDIISTRTTGSVLFVPVWCLLLQMTTLAFKDGCQIHGLIIHEKHKEPLAYERCAHACLMTNLTEPWRGRNSYFEAIKGAKPGGGDDDAENRALYESSIRLV